LSNHRTQRERSESIVQNAKDTFYVMLQSRLAALNPSRTIVLRGVVRPGTLVVENELSTASIQADAFCMEWTGLQVSGEGPLPLVAMECAISYCTDGTPDAGGMDRGRLLAGMDGELAAALGAEPRAAGKMNYSAVGAGIAAVAMSTNVFWADPVFGSATSVNGRVARSLTVRVFAYQEAGEL
jgi:hypothetical protein